MIKKSLVLLILVFYFTIAYTQPTPGDSSLESGAGGVIGGGAPIGSGIYLLFLLASLYLITKFKIMNYLKISIMKTILRISFVFLFSLMSVALMADPPAPGGGGGNAGGPPMGGGAPIGSGTVILVALGLAYLDRKMGSTFSVKE